MVASESFRTTDVVGVHEAQHRLELVGLFEERDWCVTQGAEFTRGARFALEH